MDRFEIVVKLSSIFQKIFADNSLVLSDKMTSTDVKGWDSLTHMLLITEIENVFSIKFKLKDLVKMHNVGEMINIISTKL